MNVCVNYFLYEEICLILSTTFTIICIFVFAGITIFLLYFAISSLTFLLSLPISSCGFNFLRVLVIVILLLTIKCLPQVGTKRCVVLNTFTR